MKPHVICHMVSSVDGRILSSRMRPKGANSGGLFERLHDELKGDAWLIGRVTGREFAKRKSYPATAGQAFAARTLVRPARGGRLGDRSRPARQDRLGTLRHRRRSDRRGADGAGLGRPSRGPSLRADILHLRRQAARSISRWRWTSSTASSGSSACCWKAAAARTALSCAPAWSTRSAWRSSRPSMAPRERPASSIRATRTRACRRRSNR